MIDPTDPPSARMTIAIADMTCGTCVANIEQALAGVVGVRQADFRVEQGLVTVEGTALPMAVVGAIEAAGYRARLVPEDAGESRQA
jgi:Cu+-exporting ATPase